MVIVKLEACAQAVDLSVLPPAKLTLLIQPGEPKHADFKENLFKALTQVTSSDSMDSNPRPIRSAVRHLNHLVGKQQLLQNVNKIYNVSSCFDDEPCRLVVDPDFY